MSAEFFSIKRFTKGKIFTSSFNFDQNWSISEEKNAPKMLACENSRFSSLLSAGDVHYKPQARLLGDSDV